MSLELSPSVKGNTKVCVLVNSAGYVSLYYNMLYLVYARLAWLYKPTSFAAAVSGP